MKILCVIDMQNDFIDGSLGSAEAQAIVPNVINKIKEFDGYIAYTQDTHYEAGELAYDDTLEGQKLPVKHCIYNTVGWHIPAPIKEALDKKEAISFLKNTFGSLFMADTFNAIEAEFPESIEICGLCTDICVVSNALILRALFPDVPITVDASCCAGTSPERHKAALETMKSCQIDVIND